MKKVIVKVAPSRLNAANKRKGVLGYKCRECGMRIYRSATAPIGSEVEVDDRCSACQRR